MKKNCCIPLLLLILFSTSIVGQNTYFVLTTGSENGDGSISQPWSSIQYALDQMENSDSLIIGEGIYDESIRIKKSGSALKNLVVMAAPGQKVILEPSKPGPDDAIVLIDNVSHVRLKGLLINGRYTDKALNGIEVNSSPDVIIENTDISEVLIGIKAHHLDSQYPVQNLLVRNNFIYHCAGPGIQIGSGDANGESGLIMGIELFNNTLYENDQSDLSVGQLVLMYAHECQVKNNFFQTGESGVMWSVYEYYYSIDIDYNGYYSYSGENNVIFNLNAQYYEGFEHYRSKSAKDQNSLYAFPAFLDIADNRLNLHLTPNSSLIDSGVVDWMSTPDESDIDGQVRINGRIDIGADEYYAKLIICSLGALEADLEEDEVILTWSGTCFSENGGRYHVLRSKDGQGWEKLVEISSQLDKINTQVFYTYTDLDPMEGRSYYKVSFVDDNGSSNDSNTDVIFYSRKDLLLYPNPVTSIMYIHIGKEELLNYQIFDLRGRMQIEGNTENNYIDVSSLKQGQYLLELIGQGSGHFSTVFIRS